MVKSLKYKVAFFTLYYTNLMFCLLKIYHFSIHTVNKLFSSQSLLFSMGDNLIEHFKKETIKELTFQ